MAAKEVKEERAGVVPPVKMRKPRFGEMPDDLSRFGGSTMAEGYAQGWCSSEDVAELLAAIGHPELEHYQFPLQRMARRHGELWSIRIEAPTAHLVEGKLQQLHHWVYKREQPERLSGTA